MRLAAGLCLDLLGSLQAPYLRGRVSGSQKGSWIEGEGKEKRGGKKTVCKGRERRYPHQQFMNPLLVVTPAPERRMLNTC